MVSKETRTLVSFLVDRNYQLVQDRIRGRLDLIYGLFLSSKELGRRQLEMDYVKFIGAVEEIQEFCDKPMTFVREISQRDVHGSWNDNFMVEINLRKLVVLKERLEGKNCKKNKTQTNLSKKPLEKQQDKNPFEELLTILKQPQLSSHIGCGKVPKLKLGPELDLTHLDALLVKETARTILSIEKAMLKTPRKPYFSVCDNTEHNKYLSNFCSSKGEERNIQFNPRVGYEDIIRRKLQIPQEIFRCVQNKVHYVYIVNNNTDLSLGDCSYLDTCHKMSTCRYLHYLSLVPTKPTSLDKQAERKLQMVEHPYTLGECYTEYQRQPLPPQWINCDVRYLNFRHLGKFAAIISDPAWDIHMSLPYGTCKDFELLSLPMHELQDEGLLLLWVTGRSIEVGRQSLLNWGYAISDEMIWIKLNQLRRTIVTGRTGHWLNHSKEHLLVGVKGNPPWLNRYVDMDVIVSGTRETLRKPDELYLIIERLVGVHSRKLEIFGRDHNVRPGWLSKYNINWCRIHGVACIIHYILLFFFMHVFNY